jgi:hypothetical protein
VKEAAQKLADVVEKEISARVATAQEATDRGQKWDAFGIYSRLAEQFAGFDLPAEVAAKKKELAADPQVKSGLVAAKSLDNAKRLLAAGGNAASQKRAKAALEKIVQELPGSSLAEEAASLIAEAGASGSRPSP